jgi:hypothetical protein
MTLPDRLRSLACNYERRSYDEEDIASAADLCAAAANALEAAGWRPIASAPQDGTMVLYWAAHNRARCFVGNQPPGERAGVWHLHPRGGWVGYPDWRAYEATHWMPRPAPPA